MIRKRWTPTEIKFIETYYPEKGALFCANMLGVSSNRIRDKASKLKLKFDTENLYKIRMKSPDLFAVKCDFFSKCDSIESAYLLGFIYGDGHVVYDDNEHRVIINIITSDFLDIKDIFNKSGKWAVSHKTPSSTDGFIRQPFTRISTSNRLLVEFLVSNNYHIKSGESADKILSTIPNKLRRYFLLGLIDADGCWNYGKYATYTSRRCIISSTYDQKWDYIENIYKNLNISYFITRRSGKRGKWSHITTSGKDNLQKLYNFIYPNGYIIGLVRKHNKSLECLDPIIDTIPITPR